jgi:hypothetical protein
MSASRSASRPKEAVEWALWLGLFVPPVAWFAAQQVGFVLTPWICLTGRRWVLFVVTGAALAAAAVAGIAAWRRLTSAGRSTSPGPLERRRRYLAAAGVLLSLYFLLAIAAFAIPDLLQGPCD